MSKFKEFQDELNFQTEPFWGDQGITEAADMIEHFNDDDWETLSKYQRQASLEYKLRLASVLKCCKDSRAVPILVDLLDVEDNWISVCLMETLNSLPEEFLKQIPKNSLDYEAISRRLRQGNTNIISQTHDLNILEKIRRIVGV